MFWPINLPVVYQSLTHRAINRGTRSGLTR
jgi:hypothetical protein